ncbi:MAG: tRNA preQ1(34) S-adenosylmethionine ribosyltransferase-isomerase QueA [Proteobacteria bacterium]|nr:tRNA preQ1(34) S-adenosylmethionine ribosyltransferase-isomerase QueA [Pseudomonadota bacterium]NDC23415.1 tRNA preQ1(34) S-adenosylmethionine ribosyltransferase-isomerase QueA [Pseudomonadota bacterium]NDD03572.1 tRNA preQ1(34) S-adenosylmethionine ribosyltransferase-isomerase QueA [Pseudomonadota bacterium]NDG25928.1 tRNA preQ1(34) S-adenosylmethionine ribosyltransferase-isomerase QueA [Pseudomonadota bacterium]
MLLSDFDYSLPQELIALEPCEPRDHSRLLVVNRSEGSFSHHRFYELPRFLNSGDCLVRNTSRVIPARLPARLTNGKSIEVFLIKQLDPKTQTWKCLVKPGKRVRDTEIVFLKDQSECSLSKKLDGTFEVSFAPQKDFFNWLETVGEPPLPPYIKREVTPNDLLRYQTVFCKEAGSVAAPTAGLHFTEELLRSIEKQGVAIADVLLHVGYGTFSPIRTPNINEHVMHEEFYNIPIDTLEKMKRRRQAGNRVIAVGTTTLRSLESLSVYGASGNTQLFITPGYKFKEVDGLITNFHLPQSTLFILMCALLGKALCLNAYEEAVKERYRFFSYGDAMLVL